MNKGSKMGTWLIANPKAGDGQRGAEFWLEHLEQAGIRTLTLCDLDDTSWTARVREDDLVLVAGGDGTVNKAAEICVEHQAILGVLPSGTANDFSRNLELPDDPAELCQLMARAPQRVVDVGYLNDQLFLNVSHIGLGTLPVREASGRSKKLLGRFSYSASLFRRIRAQRGFHAEISSGAQTVKGLWLSVAVASGAFYGGGNRMPEAVCDDGKLDIMAVRSQSLLRLLATFLAIKLLRRSADTQKSVVHMKSTWCTVHTHRPKHITADGELAGKTPARYTCGQGQLKVIADESR
ncbi:diacylglycerol/lipid kinase family protein [Marinobacter salicampi]|uniref:diacylglycerol/lipid kinase family protein n=1 Tax=Marinobacter salicampi TaxID=435907 RepID=UPI001F5FAB41|nr:YegS/Rv2252/BmrU family lipid kinase [Marinobacter salicampi]